MMIGKGKTRAANSKVLWDVEGYADSIPVAFPTPKYVFTIYAPNVITICEEELKEWEMEDEEYRKDNAADGNDKTGKNNSTTGEPGPYVRAIRRRTLLSAGTRVLSESALLGADDTTPESEKRKKKNKSLRIKMRSLVAKMVNRLVRDNVVQREAVQYVPSATHVTIAILIAPSLLPVLVRKCEYLGIGYLAGTQCFAVPLEMAAVPEPRPGSGLEDFIAIDAKKEEKKKVGIVTGATAATTATSSSFVHFVTKTFSKDDDEKEKKDDDDDDAEEVSSIEDEDDNTYDASMKSERTADASGTTARSGKTTYSSGSPSTFGVPVLNKKRADDLRKLIIKARQEWIATSSHVRVNQVIEEVTAGAAFTIDYVAFVFCAATIAAVGLIIDSSTSVLASMLVSPIMGPVMGMTFGTTVRKRSLILRSFRNEMMSLAICLLVGAFWGVIAGIANYPQSADKSSGWPSDEMVSRGQVLNLVTGVFIAFPSGVATALSVLGKNSSGLVGVAISLSLLPPAVNAGLCWFYGIMLRTGVATRTSNDDENYEQLGGISLALTVVNIICIWVAGVMTFWLKEVERIATYLLE